MTPVSASFARRQAETRGLDRIVILQTGADGETAVTAWARGRPEARALKAWTRSPAAARLLAAVAAVEGAEGAEVVDVAKVEPRGD